MNWKPIQINKKEYDELMKIEYYADIPWKFYIDEKGIKHFYPIPWKDKPK